MKIPYNVVEAVEKRRSVRTYEARPLASDLREKIEEYIGVLDNPFGVDVRIQIINKDLASNGEKLGTYGVIKGASTFMGLSVPKVDMALLAAGYQFENLVLYCTSLGLGTVWLAATFSRSKFQQAMGIADSDYFPAISPVGYPQKSRLFERLMRKTVGADSRKPWSELFFDGTFGRSLTPEGAGRYAQALEMLRLAPSSTNSQPWRVLKQGDTFHFYETHKPSAREEALIKQVDLGIGICHFDLTLRQTQEVEGRFFKAEPENVEKPENYHYIVSWSAD